MRDPGSIITSTHHLRLCGRVSSSSFGPSLGLMRNALIQNAFSAWTSACGFGLLDTWNALVLVTLSFYHLGTKGRTGAV